MIPKLTMRLAGGLGNQLFQFYANLAFAKRLGAVPSFEYLSDLNHSSHGESISRLFGGVSNLDFAPKTKIQVAVRNSEFVVSKRWKTYGGSKKGFWSGGGIGYSEPDFDPRETMFLRGYFQSHLYFDELKEPPLPNFDDADSRLSDLIARMKAEKPVVIHIRWGDFRSAKNINGILSADYYRAALEISAGSFESPIWLFSDQPLEAREWLKQSLGKEIFAPEVSSQMSPIETLALMAKGDRFVLANSTFSYWAALLSETPAENIFRPNEIYKSHALPLHHFRPSWQVVPAAWQ